MSIRSFRGAAYHYLLLTALLLCGRVASAQPDPLPSWNNGPAKTAIVGFIARVTASGGPDFVPPAERIAAFDNDGTLWTEQPLYVQVVFALDRIKALAPTHPEWKQQQPFKAVIVSDTKTPIAGGEPRLGIIVRHTDADREWAYDRKSEIGQLDKALDEARTLSWTVVDMKQDWKRIFLFEK